MDARYSPPSDDHEPLPPEDAEYVEASQGQRLANFLVDSIVVRLLSSAVTFMLPSIARYEDAFAYFFLALSMFIGVWFAYYAGFEIAVGRTLGKFITRTRVVTSDGDRPSPRQILGRTLARMVPFEPFSFLVRANWHDRWSGTCVVRV